MPSAVHVSTTLPISILIASPPAREHPCLTTSANVPLNVLGTPRINLNARLVALRLGASPFLPSLGANAFRFYVCETEERKVTLFGSNT